MKGLSVEEKAKRYDETIEQLRIMMPNWESLSYNGKTFLQDLVYIIPELKEIEGERIKKWLINYFREVCDNVAEKEKNAVLAWLEKQGEQKPLSHKFRIGDKVKKGYLTYTVEDIGEDSYKLQAYSKDGDKGCTEFLTIGYEKDYELVEQKPAWSEEDEEMLDTLIANYKFLCKEFRDKEHNFFIGMSLVEEDLEMINWLKSIKDRVQPQPKQEWRPSDEQLEALDSATENCAYSEYQDCLQELIKQLKKLREE